MPLWSMIKVYLVKIILVNTHLSLVSRVHVKINDPGKNINFFAGSGQTLFTKITNQTQITITLILQIVCNTMHLSTICSQHKKKWSHCYDRLCSLHVPRGKHEMHKSHSKKANDQTSHNISIKRTHKIH